MLEERVEEVLKKYELDILHASRVRGSYVLETKQGLYLYKSYTGSENRAIQEEAIQRCLIERGFTLVDWYLKDSEGTYVNLDIMGEAHIVKRWFLGEECNLQEKEWLLKAATRLAELHMAMKGIRPELPFEIRPRGGHLEEILDRHMRELHRVRTYIRGKHERNPFEVQFLGCVDEHYEQGRKAREYLACQKTEELVCQAETEGDFIHGSFSYHNLISSEEGIAVVQYDRSWLGLQLMDLYYLLRKALEKTEWEIATCEYILSGYQKVQCLSDRELRVLYGMLWFPDKFWKIANAYFNGKKSRVPGKNLVKLTEFQEHKAARDEFLLQSRSLFGA